MPVAEVIAIAAVAFFIGVAVGVGIVTKSILG